MFGSDSAFVKAPTGLRRSLEQAAREQIAERERCKAQLGDRFRGQFPPQWALLEPWDSSRVSCATRRNSCSPSSGSTSRTTPAQLAIAIRSSASSGCSRLRCPVAMISSPHRSSDRSGSSGGKNSPRPTSVSRPSILAERESYPGGSGLNFQSGNVSLRRGSASTQWLSSRSAGS